MDLASNDRSHLFDVYFSHYEAANVQRTGPCELSAAATISQLKDALGTSADATVFRKLKELSYRTSYSHRGGYYTLDEIARFSELGLWSFPSVPTWVRHFFPTKLD